MSNIVEFSLCVDILTSRVKNILLQLYFMFGKIFGSPVKIKFGFYLFFYRQIHRVCLLNLGSSASRVYRALNWSSISRLIRKVKISTSKLPEPTLIFVNLKPAVDLFFP